SHRQPSRQQRKRVKLVSASSFISTVDKILIQPPFHPFQHLQTASSTSKLFTFALQPSPTESRPLTDNEKPVQRPDGKRNGAAKSRGELQSKTIRRRTPCRRNME